LDYILLIILLFKKYRSKISGTIKLNKEKHKIKTTTTQLGGDTTFNVNIQSILLNKNINIYIYFFIYKKFIYFYLLLYKLIITYSCI